MSMLRYIKGSAAEKKLHLLSALCSHCPLVRHRQNDVIGNI